MKQTDITIKSAESSNSNKKRSLTLKGKKTLKTIAIDDNETGESVELPNSEGTEIPVAHR